MTHFETIWHYISLAFLTAFGGLATIPTWVLISWAFDTQLAGWIAAWLFTSLLIFVAQEARETAKQYYFSHIPKW